MKIYTGVVVHNNKSVVGYLLSGEHNKQYALNVFEVNTIDSVEAHKLGIMRAISWVKHNKPLYCALSNIQHYTFFQESEEFTKMLDNAYLKQFDIKRPELNEEDTKRLYQVNQNIQWKIQKQNSIRQYSR